MRHSTVTNETLLTVFSFFSFVNLYLYVVFEFPSTCTCILSYTLHSMLMEGGVCC